MYLTELVKYYQRMSADPESGMPPPGFSEENISFKLVITPEGGLKEVISLNDSKGKPSRLKVPASKKRAVNVVPNFLWDNTGYVLGVDSKGKDERTRKTFQAFRDLHAQTADSTQNQRLLALAKFLVAWNPEQFADLSDHQALLDQQLVFQYDGDNGPLHQQPDILNIWEAMLNNNDGPTGTCLITGRDNCVISRIHPAIKGVPGAQTAGAALVSFTPDAFKSYGLEDSYNAPVSEEAARAYVGALNYLVRRENEQCVQLGDTRVVFWAERPSPVEKLFSWFLDTKSLNQAPAESEQPQDEEKVAEVRSLLLALRQGKPIDNELESLGGNTRFFILGLAPNAARLSVRFWHTESFGELAQKVGRHFAHCALEKQYDSNPELPSVRQFLLAVAVQGEAKNIPPLLGGQLARAIFTGNNYPESLYQTALGRIKADKRVDYLRASLLAAYLRRNHKGSITMSLDIERNDAPYLLGRLFSLLAKAQKDALGSNLNSSIVERYLASASANPARVFPLLLRLAQHHLKKAKSGPYLSRQIADVMEGLGSFPLRLGLEEQGTFFIGYYHQSNANYAKKSDQPTDIIETEE